LLPLFGRLVSWLLLLPIVWSVGVEVAASVCCLVAFGVVVAVWSL
jgi:hypothetical protein